MGNDGPVAIWRNRRLKYENHRACGRLASVGVYTSDILWNVFLLMFSALIACFLSSRGSPVFDHESQTSSIAFLILLTIIAESFTPVVGETDLIAKTKGHPMGGLLCLFDVGELIHACRLSIFGGLGVFTG
ncbi:hypothetical protein GC175_27025 [bacterium]|nr:hypothetical protein [bacterium]